MAIGVKICGLSTPESVDAAVRAGTRYVGFVFFPSSPRAVAIDTAAGLMARAGSGVTRVGVVVDADDDLLDRIVAIGADLIQAHGQESPERIAEMRARFGRPVMKGLAIGTADDVVTAARYDGVADRLLFDARPPPHATRPGGNAASFDPALIADHHWSTPWLLAGGLTVETMADAVAASGAREVDVSSGVETAPGVKSIAKITRFLEKAGTL